MDSITFGDDQSISCPWCEKEMGPFELEDLGEEDVVTECKHCDKKVTLCTSWHISIRAERRE